MLSRKEIEDKLIDLSDWILIPGNNDEADAIQKLFSFGDYLQGIDFVKAVALKAEELNHHPDILVKYAKVIVTISTHDAGGVTDKDFQLAECINLIAKQ